MKSANKAWMAMAIAATIVASGSADAAVIAPTGVTATTWYDANHVPANMINGAGLTVSGPVTSWTHLESGVATGMWHAGAGAGVGGGAPIVANQQLVFDLGNTYDLTTAYIWQMNQTTVFGRGVKDFNVYVASSANPNDWTLVGSRSLLISGGGAITAQSKAVLADRVGRVRFDIVNTHSGATNEYVGLSEVRFEGAVTAAPAGLSNVALNQYSNVTASAQGFGGTATAAVDNVTNNFGVHSASNAGTQFWQIDLGGSIRLDNVNFFARSGLVNRVHGSTVKFYDAAGGLVATSTVNINNGLEGRLFFDEPTLVRSIRVEKTGDYLNFNEFQAFATNLAAGKAASESSDLGGYPASRATDGALNNFTHTTTGDLTPWWKVDLGQFNKIDSVILHNRDDCCPDRLQNITVELLAADGQTVLAKSGVLNAGNTGVNPNGSVGNPASLGFDLHEVFGRDLAGRFIRVSKNGQYLSLGEVQVYGADLQAQTNAAAGYYNVYNVDNVHTSSFTLQNATALASQPSPSLLVGQTIDGNKVSGGWGDGPGFANNVAVWETAGDFTRSSSAVLEFVMTFASFSDHGLGMFRLSATTADRSLFADGAANGGQLGDDSIWTVLDDLVGFGAASGLKLAGGDLQSGGWFLIDDTFNAGTDVYTILLNTDLAKITGFRLEALKDGSLTGGGPGLSNSNGNFVLTEFEVNIAHIPTPAAMPAGLVMLTLTAMRRRPRN